MGEKTNEKPPTKLQEALTFHTTTEITPNGNGSTTIRTFVRGEVISTTTYMDDHWQRIINGD